MISKLFFAFRNEKLWFFCSWNFISPSSKSLYLHKFSDSNKELSLVQRVIVHRLFYCAGTFCRLFVTRFSTTYISCCSFSYDTFYRDDCSRPHVQRSKVCVSSLIWHVFIAQQLLPQENHKILKINDFWSWMEITAKGIECIAKSIALIKQSALVLYQVSVSCGFLLSYYNFGLHYISVSSTQNHSFLHVG